MVRVLPLDAVAAVSKRLRRFGGSLRTAGGVEDAVAAVSKRLRRGTSGDEWTIGGGRSRRCFKEIEAETSSVRSSRRRGDAVAAVSKRLRRRPAGDHCNASTATQSPLFQRD